MIPDSKVRWANMGPIWGRQDSGGPHVGPINFATWDYIPRKIMVCNCLPMYKLMYGSYHVIGSFPLANYLHGQISPS